MTLLIDLNSNLQDDIKQVLIFKIASNAKLGYFDTS